MPLKSVALTDSIYMDDYSLAKSIFGDWSSIIHTVVAGVLSYFGLIVWLRVSGKRTLSKWNSFDFVVTIALGSILASVLMTKGNSFLQCMVAIGLLVGLQLIITWISVRSDIIQKLVKAEPTLLVFKGGMQEQVLVDKRVAKGEVLSAIRLNGNASVEEIDAVILETDGTFSVIQKVDLANATAMRDVRGFRDNAVAYASEPQK